MKKIDIIRCLNAEIDKATVDAAVYEGKKYENFMAFDAVRYATARCRLNTLKDVVGIIIDTEKDPMLALAEYIMMLGDSIMEFGRTMSYQNMSIDDEVTYMANCNVRRFLRGIFTRSIIS